MSFAVVLPDEHEHGAVRSQVLGAVFAQATGPRLSVSWSEGNAQI
jgi:hypothetical protein